MSARVCLEGEEGGEKQEIGYKIRDGMPVVFGRRRRGDQAWEC